MSDTRSDRRARAATAPADQVDTSDPVASRRDWSWRHGPVIGPLNAGLGLTGAAMVADLAAVSPWWGTAAGLAAAAGVTVRAASQQVSPLGLTYRAVCWAGAGGWMSWALATSTWSPDVLAAVAVGTLAAGLAAPEMSDHETRVATHRRRVEMAAAQAQTAAAAAARRVAIATEWEARLERVCRVRGTLVQAVQAWPEDAGYTLQVRLPRGGTTWQQIAGFGDGLAADADLPHGCGVEIGPGNSRGVVLLRVATVDTTAEARPYPSDYSPLSFTGPLPIGMERNSKIAEVELLEDPAIIIGRRGSGKTVTLQTVNADLVRCPDALIWHIDLNGAGMSLPWLAPWFAGETERPVIDWVAPTVDEAVVMVEAAIDMAKGRKSVYQQRMADVDDDKLPIDAQVPAIVIVLDEGAEAVATNRGNRRLATALETLVSVARAARVGLILSGLRATADIIPVGIQAQSGVKMWIRPEDPHEVAQLLGWQAAKVSIADAPYPGSGLMKRPGEPAITPYRGYHLRPVQIRDIARACEQLRPMLDIPTANFGGTAYTRRWDRYRAWHAANGGTMTTTPDPATPAEPNEPATTGDDSTDAQKRPKGMAGLASAAAALDADREKLRKLREAAEARNAGKTGKTDQPSVSKDVDTAFAAIVGAEDWSGPTTGDSSNQGNVESPQQRMLSILRAAGENGLHRDELLARLAKVGISISKATLYRWLKDAGPAVKSLGDRDDSRWAVTESDNPEA